MVEHEQFIRECHDLAISAGKKGNQTFGALLVHNGEIVIRAENTVNTDRDDFRHAEHNLVLKSRAVLTPQILRESTLYTSTAPCLLCTATILYAEIGRIVFSVSYQAFVDHFARGYKYITCTEIAQRLGKQTDIKGPVLEKEGLRVFQYWEGRQP